MVYVFKNDVLRKPFPLYCATTQLCINKPLEDQCEALLILFSEKCMQTKEVFFIQNEPSNSLKKPSTHVTDAAC